MREQQELEEQKNGSNNGEKGNENIFKKEKSQKPKNCFSQKEKEEVNEVFLNHVESCCNGNESAVRASGLESHHQNPSLLSTGGGRGGCDSRELNPDTTFSPTSSCSFQKNSTPCRNDQPPSAFASSSPAAAFSSSSFYPAAASAGNEQKNQNYKPQNTHHTKHPNKSKERVYGENGTSFGSVLSNP